MIIASDLQEILEAYPSLLPPSRAPEYDAEELSRYIASQVYVKMRQRRPNLMALLYAACDLINDTLKNHDLIIYMTPDGMVEVSQEVEGGQISAGNTFVEALIHFGDSIE